MYITVHVYAGMKKEAIKKSSDTTYEIITKAPAERNCANKRVREIIAETYGITTQQVRIVSGHHNQRKMLEVIQDV